VTFAAGVLRGAGGRLLPPSVPFRFFGLAALAHAAFWALLWSNAAQLAGFRGGPAPLLAAVHVLTLGVLVATAIGAAVQILPVFTRRRLAVVWPVRLVFWLLLPGLALLVFGFQAIRPEALGAGAALAGIAVLLFVGLLADNLRRTSPLTVVLAYSWAALAALALTILLGVATALNFRWGFLVDHPGVAHAHFVLGGFGAMGLLALGFSHVLVPMFTLAAAPDERRAWAGFAAAVLAVAGGAAGVLVHSTPLAAASGVVGLAAAALHVRLMREALRTGMRKRLGLSFVLVRAAWAMLPATLIAGLVTLLRVDIAGGPAAFGVLLFAGWLLTFMLAILQRILPMLASMHVAAAARRNPMLPAEGLQGITLKVHAVCHALALAGVLAGTIADVTGLVQAGAVAGFVGAVAFAAFSGDVMRKAWQSAAR
jgi:hypothetical protein